MQTGALLRSSVYRAEGILCLLVGLALYPFLRGALHFEPFPLVYAPLKSSIHGPFHPAVARLLICSHICLLALRADGVWPHCAADSSESVDSPGHLWRRQRVEEAGYGVAQLEFGHIDQSQKPPVFYA